METLLNLDPDTLIRVLSWTNTRTLRTWITTNTTLARFIREHRNEICRQKLALMGQDFRAFSDPDPCYIYQHRRYFTDPATLFHLSMNRNDGRALRLSLEMNSSIDPALEDNIAIRWACERGFLEVVNVLLEDPRVNPADYENHAFILAITNGHLDIVNRLLEDARIHVEDNLVAFASEYGHLDILNRLLEEPGVNPAAQDNIAIILASQYGNLDIVERLLMFPEVNPAAQDNLAIILASQYGNLEIVERLLDDPRVDPSVLT